MSVQGNFKGENSVRIVFAPRLKEVYYIRAVAGQHSSPESHFASKYIIFEVYERDLNATLFGRDSIKLQYII